MVYVVAISITTANRSTSEVIFVSVKTLAELKQENVEAESKATEEPQEDVTEEVEEETEADEQEAESEESEAEESNDLEDEAEGESELWMQSDEQASQDDEQTFTSSDIAVVRRKLKGKVKEVTSENEELKQRLNELEQQLKTGSQPQQSAPQEPLKRPKREDFDYDDDKYEAALDEYYDKKLEQKLQGQQSQVSQQEQAERQRQQIEQATEAHYQRAAKLVESGKVSAENYQKADSAFRASIDNLLPGQGDAVADSVIAQLNNLGEGSEKVVYKLGIDPAARSKFEQLLRQDGSGLSAMAYLGSLQSQIASAKTTNKVSRAPRPGAKVSGDKGGSMAALKRKYDAAHKAGDLQKAWSIKKQAKAAGENTREW